MNDSLQSPQTFCPDPQNIRRCRGNQLCQSSAHDARWHQALELVRSKNPASVKQHGPQVVRLVRYLRSTQAASLDEATASDPFLGETIKLYAANKLQRLELQCRLLARQSSKEIAYELKTQPEAVELYHDLYYDVRSQLGTMTDHLFQHVIGMSFTGLSSLEAHARLIAYRNGPGTIPSWIDYLPHSHEEHDLTTESGRQREAMALSLAAEAINPTESPEDRVIRNLDELHYHFSRPKPPRIVTEIIQMLMPRMLQERAVDMPENADVVPVDFADSKTSNPLTDCA